MAHSWRGPWLVPPAHYPSDGQPSSDTRPHPAFPVPQYEWNGMAPAHFMGEDGYGSFASLDADLLRLPNNSGNGGLSLVYNTVREPDDFTVASSCPRQPLPTVMAPCMTVGRVGGMVGAGAGTGTLTTSPPGPTAHPQRVSRQATCALSPTGFGAAASPAKPTDAHQRDHMDTSALRAPSANRKDMEDRIVMFMMSKHGGNCAHKVDQNKKGPNRICQKCTGDDCTFCVVATKKQSVWAVDFRKSSFVHHGGCCSRGAPKFSLRLSTVRCVRSAVRNRGHPARQLPRLTKGFEEGPWHPGLSSMAFTARTWTRPPH